MRFSPNQKLVVAAVYVCGMILNSLDSTIVNVALATLAREFSVPPDSIDTVVTAYLISLAVFIPVSGWLGDRWGTKRTFLLALGLFTGASALCGMAQSIDQLVAFRILQGAGGGLLTPVGMAMLYRAFPPAERVQVSRILMFATILGPALGPVIGGFLVERISWRWIFYVNLPVGLAALVFGLVFLHEHREEDAGSFDIPGFLLAGVGFGSFMFAVGRGPVEGWTRPEVVLFGLIGVVALTAFVLVEQRVKSPMVQLHLLSNRLLRSALAVSFFTSSAFMGTLFLMPLFLQEAKGVSPLQSGLTTFPEALGVVVSTQLVARLYPRIGPRRLMSGGLAFVALVIASMATIDHDTSLWIVRAQMFLLGFGIAYVFLPSQVASMATITSAQTGRASTLSMVQRQLGGAIGVALLSSILTIAAASSGIEAGLDADAYRIAFIGGAVLALIGAGVAQKIPDADAAGTMVRGGRRARIAVEAAD
ncbi:MAG: MDR family MFS transporter [Thermomicrobiales bacterium]